MNTIFALFYAYMFLNIMNNMYDPFQELKYKNMLLHIMEL
jgi:hypothetical protein